VPTVRKTEGLAFIFSLGMVEHSGGCEEKEHPMATKSRSADLKKPTMTVKERRAAKRAKNHEERLTVSRRKRPERT
jgi:hypothetical protein